MSCGVGFILRKGYTRKGYFRSDGTYVEDSIVPAVCIIDQGKPGKGVKLIQGELDEILSPFGYKLALSDLERKKILMSAFDELDRLKLLRHLVYLRTLNKSRENLYNKLDKDVKLIQNMYKETPKRKSPKKRSPRRR
jgi:glycosyltransferase involved in cell wall biosynthesis